MKQKTPTRPISQIVHLIIWLTGVLVSLAVGFGMKNQVLTIPSIHPMIVIVAGWIVIVLTILSVILAIIDRLK
ncbi:MAG: hypothetical protein ABIH37_05900 [archaeon]